jgi:hypothetical protein
MTGITQQYIGTTEEWEDENPILPEAVWAFEKTEDGKTYIKLGTGTDPWNDLPYVTKDNIKGLPEELNHIINDMIPSDDTPEMDGAGSPGDPENWHYSRSNHRHPRDTAIAEGDAALAAALESEAETRAEHDDALQRDLDAWIGRGGYLDEHDFGAATPTQEELTDYALSQIPSITDPAEIWNGTKVKNEFDNHEWILTNTQDTDPVVFEWTDQGVAAMVPFDADIGGYILGADDDDPDGTIEAAGGGKGRPKGWNSLVQAQFDLEHPVGSTFTQDPWDLFPADRNWPGNWVNWSFRSWEYCLSQTAPPSGFIADWKLKRHDVWNLNTDGSVATQGTKKYTVPADYARILRQVIHNGVWDDGDLEEGGQVQGGAYDGWYVWQVLAPAGIFPSVEDDDGLPDDDPVRYTGGGLRPPFISGGVAPDMARKIEGTIFAREEGIGNDNGVFYGYVSSSYRNTANTLTGYGHKFDNSRVVSTGPQNSPVTASIRIWRRLPDVSG